MGTSALYLCQALLGRPGALHVAVDPNQDTQYRGIARANLQRVRPLNSNTRAHMRLVKVTII